MKNVSDIYFRMEGVHDKMKVTVLVLTFTAE